MVVDTSQKIAAVGGMSGNELNDRGSAALTCSPIIRNRPRRSIIHYGLCSFDLVRVVEISFLTLDSKFYNLLFQSRALWP